MESKNRLLDYLKGWFPKEPYSMHSRESVNRQSSIPAYAVSYGVGIGVCEAFTIMVYALGWGAIESSLSPDLSILLGILIVMPGTMLGLAIGAILSKKLKKGG